MSGVHHSGSIILACIDCSTPISRQSKTGRCRPCTARNLNAQGWFQERRREGMGCRPARLCAGCGKTVDRRNQVGMCLVCFNRDPTFKAKRGMGVSRQRQRRARIDPAFAEMQRERGRTMAASRAGVAAIPAGSEARKRAGRNRSASVFAWCPPGYRPLYENLRKNRGLGADEARARTLRQVDEDRFARLASTRMHDVLFHLRRLAPVTPKEDGYQYGTVLLTAEQLVERALQKGWQP